jgi:hypothetical protein
MAQFMDDEFDRIAPFTGPKHPSYKDEVEDIHPMVVDRPNDRKPRKPNDHIEDSFGGDDFDVEFGDPTLTKALYICYTTPGKNDPYEDVVKDAKQAQRDNFEDVKFGDPKLMELTTEKDHLRNFIAGYPYTSFRSLCRKLNLTPAEALKRITPLVPDEVNCVWSPEDTLKAITAEVEGEIEREWEPGVKPEPITDEALADLVADHVRCEFHTSRNWSVADLAHRSGRDAKDVVKATIQKCLGRVLSHFKYTEFDPHVDEVKWLLSPTEIAEAAVNCDWIKTADRRITAGDFAVYKTADGEVGYTYLEPEKEGK